MEKILNLLGDIAAVAGLLICLISGLARVSGHYYLVGYEAMTLFSIGVAAIVVSILAKVQLLLIKK